MFFAYYPKLYRLFKKSTSKAAGSEKAEAYGKSTLKPSSNENAAGGIFQQSVIDRILPSQCHTTRRS